MKHVIAAVFLHFQVKGAFFSKFSRHCVLSFYASDPALCLRLFEELESELKGKRVCALYFEKCLLSPVAILSLEGSHDVLNVIFGKYLIYFGDVESFYFDASDVIEFYQIVLLQVVEGSLKSHHVVVVDVACVILGELVEWIGEVDEVRASKQMLIGGELQVYIARRGRQQFCLSLPKLPLKLVFVPIHVVALHVLHSIVLFVISVSEFLTKIKVGLTQLLADLTVVHAVAYSPFQKTQLGHLLRIDLLGS